MENIGIIRLAIDFNRKKIVSGLDTKLINQKLPNCESDNGDASGNGISFGANVSARRRQEMSKRGFEATDVVHVTWSPVWFC